MNSKVSQYIADQPSPQKEILLKLRMLILKNFPTIEETFKLGVPCYRIFYLVGLKDHVNLGVPIERLTDEEICLFQGHGKTVRVLEIASLEELDEEKIVSLLRRVWRKYEG